MPELNQEALIQFFGQFAYQPVSVYAALIGFMIASSFGFPIPEEITLVSVGLVAYLAKNPEIYPPPYPDADPVNAISLAIVAFFAVFLSDALVYLIGRVFGRRALRFKPFRRLIDPRSIRKIEKWSQKYGAYAAGVFRFTPGLRFPGHFMCGATKLPFVKFAAVDGTAALLSVPTQVLLLAYYGEVIIGFLQQSKLVILVLFLAFISYMLVNRFRKKRSTAQ